MHFELSLLAPSSQAEEYFLDCKEKSYRKSLYTRYIDAVTCPCQRSLTPKTQTHGWNKPHTRLHCSLVMFCASLTFREN